MKYQASLLCKLFLPCSADFSCLQVVQKARISALVNNLTSWQVDILQ
jgi:hypothetical protein